MKTKLLTTTLAATLLALTACDKNAPAAKSATALLNVSYDPTREFYTEINEVFRKDWQSKTNQTLEIKQSHGGSGKQARSVIDGLEADVVTLALAGDIDVLAKEAELLPADWQTKLPDNSSPYTSTIVFVVRKGNPKSIKDWPDLVNDGIQVITPNPKTSGGARWNYLAAWAWADKQFSGDQAKVLDYMTRLFKNVPVLDTGARGSTTTFAQRGIGDIFLSWENEAHLIEKEFPGKTEIVFRRSAFSPSHRSRSLRKTRKNTAPRNSRKPTSTFLYTAEAQDIAGKHFYRPRNAKALEKWSKNFPKINLVTIDKDFGGWTKAQKTHFDDGGTFDQVYGNR